jgi:hypothetical protein
MSILRAFVIIVLSGLVAAGLGGAIGLGLGTLIPGYYSAMFRRGGPPLPNEPAIGLALGLTQGLAAGLAIGCVVVLAVAIAVRRHVSAVTDQSAASAWAGGPRTLADAGQHRSHDVKKP